MKIVGQGSTFRIYDSAVETYDSLPPCAYTIRFEQRSGFWLEKSSVADITEGKIYGVHDDKCAKVLRSFEAFKRNLGVILSGDKGIGKSLFAKLLATRAMSLGYPLIIVDRYIPGIAAYIENIEQECVVMFDEFDKTFGEVKAEDGQASPQAELLSLFDGFAHGKKLFVITCNEIDRLNSFLINRPGRFHYHFRFEYPSADEIREYMMDNIPTEYHGEIESVVLFSRKIPMNYDCLRAVAFELSSGLSFDDAIADLNIVNLNREEYKVFLMYENGLRVTAKSARLDMFSDDDESLWLADKNDNYFVKALFSPSDAVWSVDYSSYIITPDNFKLIYDDDELNEEEMAVYKGALPKCLVIRMDKQRDIHYRVRR